MTKKELLRRCREFGIAYWEYVEDISPDRKDQGIGKETLAKYDLTLFALRCACTEFTEDVRTAMYGERKHFPEAKPEEVYNEHNVLQKGTGE